MSRVVTKKIVRASEILGAERLADDPDFVLGLYKRGEVSREQIYRAVEHFGYRWKNGRWVQAWPRWFENAVRKRDRTISGWVWGDHE